jgi:hypothetical protein
MGGRTLIATGGPLCYQLPPDVARCPLFEGNQLRTCVLSTALDRAQLLSLSQALTWVQPHVAQPVLLCAQNTVRQLRGWRQGTVHNARLKAHTQFVQQALGAAGQSVDSLRPAVTRFQECLPRLWRVPWALVKPNGAQKDKKKMEIDRRKIEAQRLTCIEDSWTKQEWEIRELQGTR